MFIVRLSLIVALIFIQTSFASVFGDECSIEGDNKLIITTTNTHLYLFFDCEHCDNNESFTTAPSLTSGKYLGIPKFKDGALGILFAIVGCLTGMIEQDLPGMLIFENGDYINGYFFEEDPKIKTFKLNNKQAQSVLLFLKDSFQKEKNGTLKYNLQKYNCINFGVDAYNSGGLQETEGDFYEHFLVKGDYNSSNPSNTVVDIFTHLVKGKSKWSVFMNWLLGNLEY